MLIPLTLTGCWNYKEIDQLTIAAGMAIDKTAEDKYLVTIEIVHVKEKGQSSETTSELIEIEGETVFDAIRNAISVNSHKLYWPHAKIIILSQEVAREGAADVLDFLYRDPEPRETIYLLVSESETAREIFDEKSIGVVIKSFEVDQMLRDEDSLSKTLPIQLYKFSDALGDNGISPVMSAICLTEVKGQKTIKLCGTSIFKNDRFMGFLNEDETKSLCFATDKVKGGVLVVKMSPEDKKENITLEISKNKTKIKPVYSNNKLSIDIQIKTEVTIGSHPAKGDFASEKGLAELKKTAEKQLEAEIKSVVRKVQKDFDSDVFGFGRAFRREMPSLWKVKEKEWDAIFKDLEVSVNSNIEIANSGLLSKPIKIGD
jgi:spore germination protein KC